MSEDFTLTDQDRAAIESHLRASDKLRAVLVVRQATGAGLKEAVDFIAEFERKLDPPLVREDIDMGMSAQILAVGPFGDEVAEHLMYAAKHYEGTRAGVPVVQFLFECYGSTQSRELAACFGIDPWDFNEHKLDPAKADLPQLQTMFPEDGQREVASFLALRDAGFDFYYLPNG